MEWVVGVPIIWKIVTMGSFGSKYLDGGERYDR